MWARISDSPEMKRRAALVSALVCPADVKRKLPRRHRFATFDGLPELVFIIGNIKSVGM
jgi:hypothetical protein